MHVGFAGREVLFPMRVLPIVFSALYEFETGL